MNPKPGQVWRDTVNGDLLLVKETDSFPLPNGDGKCRQYARCLAFCKPGTWDTRPEVQFMGMQEMQFKHFETERFKQVNWFQALYYRWRMKTWVKAGRM